MELIPKWLRDWITRLMPKHESSGNGAVHVGHVNGNVHHVTQVHHHFYAPAAVPDEHQQVQALIDQLPTNARKGVYGFMRKSFGTSRVVDLVSGDLLRVRRYVETINRRMGKEKP